MLTLKTAIGIAVRGQDLEFLCLKRKLGGVEVSGQMRLEKYRSLHPAEAGGAYREFLKSQGVRSANAVLALPRGEALLRILALPIEAESSLAQAIEYQVDSLHPFEEGGVDYDFAVLQKQEARGLLQVAVVMVEKKTAAAYSDWLAQAGIPVAGFTVSTAALYGLLAARPRPLILMDRHAGRVELLGLSSDAVVSREFADAPQVMERELALCRSEMRLAPEAEIAQVEAEVDLCSRAAAHAAAGGRVFPINLLPKEKRVYRSPWDYAPTYVLAAVVALLAVALGVRGLIQDRLYLGRLDTETRRLETKVKYVEKLDSKQRQTLDRILLLNSLKADTALKMEALAELSRILPASAWLQEVDFREGTAILQGTADSAAGLLGQLGASPHFRNAEFLSSITRNGEGKDLFRIRLRVAGQPGGKP